MWAPGWERWFLVAIVLLEFSAGVAYMVRGNIKLGVMWILYAAAAACLTPWKS